MKLSKELYAIASSIAHETDSFFDTKGPGAGNLSTNQFIDLVRSRAEQAFGEDYSEQKICGDNSMAGDFYFPEEQTVVEIALGIKNPNTEFEKDILITIFKVYGDLKNIKYQHFKKGFLKVSIS